ncbi:hypothetical protein DMENIID0001_109320 [Sergentomyia squamirostris]
MESIQIKLLILLSVTFMAFSQGLAQSLPSEISPEFFPTAESPLKQPHHSPEYVDFINKLYGHDSSKKPIAVDEPTPGSRHLRDLSADKDLENLREKRAIIFRPLFVYKQQQIKKQKRKEDKQKQKPKPAAATTTTAKPPPRIPANHGHYIVYNNKIYTQYNPYYAPYQYGQRFPYLQ